MKTAIISTQPLHKTNLSAFIRIIRFMSENISNISIIHENFDRVHEDFDNIIVAYGTFYADFKGMMSFLDRYKDKRFIYLINEYSLVPNGDIYRFLIKHDYEVIANYQEGSVGARHYSRFNMLNLNLTAFRELEVFPFDRRSRRLIYWGTYRPDRDDYFKKYFHNITLSTSDRSRQKFGELFNSESFNNLHIIDRVDFNETSVLNQYKFSLYIEDNYTHTHFNHLADRFYEALSMGLITFFDEDTRNNVQLSGYEIGDFYFVKSRNELEEKMNAVEKNPEAYLIDLEKLRAQARKEKKELVNSIIQVLNSEKVSFDLICPYCKEKCCQYFKCVECSKQICSRCIEIHKKHYCEECYNKLPKKRKEQLTLF